MASAPEIFRQMSGVLKGLMNTEHAIQHNFDKKELKHVVDEAMRQINKKSLRLN